MSSIESLSKRLDPKLTCSVEQGDVPATTENYYRIVRRFLLDDWKHLSPAQVTIKVVDPALDQFADLLNEWESALAGALPLSEDKRVTSFVSKDGQVPVRMLITPAKGADDRDEIVVIIDILAMAV